MGRTTLSYLAVSTARGWVKNGVRFWTLERPVHVFVYAIVLLFLCIRVASRRGSGVCNINIRLIYGKQLGMCEEQTMYCGLGARSQMFGERVVSGLREVQQFAHGQCQSLSWAESEMDCSFFLSTIPFNGHPVSNGNRKRVVQRGSRDDESLVDSAEQELSHWVCTPWRWDCRFRWQQFLEEVWFVRIDPLHCSGC